MPVNTLAELFLEVASRDKRDCLLHKVGDEWRAVSTEELAERVRRLAAALLDAGIEPGDRIALLAENGVHWPVVDFATLTIGAVLVPIYPTLTPDQATYIAADCGARVLFVQGHDYLSAMIGRSAAMPHIERFVQIGDPDRPTPDARLLDDIIAATGEPDPAVFEERASAVRPDDLATFIYTSGTTGKPKGVMLTHGNIASNVTAVLSLFDFDPVATTLSFLPLSHSFERMFDYCYFKVGATIAYSESVRSVPSDLLEVRPHVFVSVPRVYEKMLAKIRETIERQGGLNRKIFDWAVAVGQQALPFRLAGRRPEGLLGLQLALADRLVFSRIRARLGGRYLFAASGGAPLPVEVAEFFWGAGVTIYEGYGLSETSPVLTANHPKSTRLGTVGPPIPGVEIEIAPDGEILARGPCIMRGYFNMPDATAEAIDDDGWFHTGDIGEVDDAGHLRITGRKKELIVNAYGKNIAPAPIENALKASPFIEHAVVIGDRRKFLSALLVPDFAALAARLGSSDPPNREVMVADDAVRRLLEEEIARINTRFSGYQQVKAWELLADEFSIETGELTPTQKIKRRVIQDRYGEVIDRIYRSAEEAGGRPD
jgi:long-chain acyl-CoA synthetase